MGTTPTDQVDPETLDSDILNEIWRLRTVRRQSRLDMIVRAALSYDDERGRGDQSVDSARLCQREDALLAALRYATDILVPPDGISSGEVEAARSMLQARIEVRRAERERLVAEAYASGKLVSLTERRAQRYG